MEILAESIRICRWNIKHNSFPTTRNGNFQGKDSDLVCCSLIFFINFNKEQKINWILKKGQEIGSGHFGRVVKAEAVGLKNADENVTSVAVKMVKPTAKSKDAIVALVRELKILIYLGGHLNVVNLLGACTKTNVIGKNQTTRKDKWELIILLFHFVEEFLVLIDFCHFGNLKSYLIKNRNQFVNQLSGSGEMQPVYETAEIDTMER